MSDVAERQRAQVTEEVELDVIVVGAGFAGLYSLLRLREMGFRVLVLEAGGGVGGTWYWNRYPGARCDVESVDYSYAFSPELDQEWTWSEKFSPQPEIEAYLNFVADKYDLRRSIELNTRVSEAHWDEAANCWHVRTSDGDRYAATYCIMATGMLSEPNVPDIPGLDSFKGTVVHTGLWPHEDPDVTGNVAILGTGSSGVQLVPEVARVAKSLTVFQRTANYSLPADNGPIDDETMRGLKAEYPKRREAVRDTFFGNMLDVVNKSALEATEAERDQWYREQWNRGSFSVLLSYNDLLIDPAANKTMADFLEARIREKVKDPEVAEKLVPKGYPAGTKRMCVDSGFYETFNRENVTLVHTPDEPILEVTPTSIRTSEREFEVDTILLATGFDAFTGALARIDIRGCGGLTLKEKWKNGPRAYLGVMMASFPNLFIPTGPGSPSVLSNVAHSAEQHAKWVTDCIEYLRDHDFDYIEPRLESEDTWAAHVDEVANMTLYPKANSWYMGANIPGKPKMFMAYLGGIKAYREQAEGVAKNGYDTCIVRAVGAPSRVGADHTT